MIRVEYTSLDQIKTWERNPKDHDIGKLHCSMDRWGYVQPVLVNERSGRLVAGHGRIETLVQMRINRREPPTGIQISDEEEWLVPVIRGVEFETEEEAEAYGVADNRLVILGGWNESKLLEVLTDLASLQEHGLSGTGYDAADLDDLLRDFWDEEGSKDSDTSPSIGEMEYRLIIECSNEKEQIENMYKLDEIGIKYTAQIV